MRKKTKSQIREEKKKKVMKVSGKSVFKLKNILDKKTPKTKER